MTKPTLWEAVRTPAAPLHCNICAQPADVLWPLRIRLPRSVTPTAPNGSFGMLAVCVTCATNNGKRAFSRPIYTASPRAKRPREPAR
jgi:hypothetical protein